MIVRLETVAKGTVVRGLESLFGTNDQSRLRNVLCKSRESSTFEELCVERDICNPVATTVWNIFAY